MKVEALHTDAIEQVYERLARFYDLIFDKALEEGRLAAVELLDIQPGERVLEIGVGTGLALPYYPRNCSVTGIDISEAMLSRARKRLEAIRRDDVKLMRMDASRLDFEDESFDKVVVPYVLSVVNDPRRVLAEMVRVARRGVRTVVVNHFMSQYRIVAAFDQLISPLTYRILGYNMFTPIDVLRGNPGLEVQEIRKVNLFKLWRLAVCRITK